MENQETVSPPQPSIEIPSPSPPPPSTSPPVGKRSRKKLLIILLVLILLDDGALTSYWYSHHNQVRQSAKPVVSSSTSNVGQSASASSVHFVQSIGYPYDTSASKYQFVTKLGVPGTMQAVRTASTTTNRDTEKIFTNLLNNELGRWELGNPIDQQDNGAGASDISLLAITSSWLNTIGPTDFSSYGYGNPLQTPTQKQQFINKLKSSTSSCIKDPTKGFKTIDGNLNVCFSFYYGREGYGPQVNLSGYGDIQNQQIILEGMVSIYDSSVGTSQDAQRKAVSDANVGNPPAVTVQAQKDIISALEQTTVTASPVVKSQ